jgi:putative transposase
VIAEGLLCGMQRIEHLMRQNALKARPRRRTKKKACRGRLIIAPNLLDRQFIAHGLNQKWGGDFTYV